MVPSIKTIADRLAVRPETARVIRRALEDDSPLSALDNCNAFLHGSGIERIGNPALYYVNLGDPYVPTVLYDERTARFRVAPWGNVVERQPARFRD